MPTLYIPADVGPTIPAPGPTCSFTWRSAPPWRAADTALNSVSRLVAHHLYDRETAALIEGRAERLRLVQTPYDWRPNR